MTDSVESRSGSVAFSQHGEREKNVVETKCAEEREEKSKMGKGDKIPAFLSTTKNEELESGYFTFHVFE